MKKTGAIILACGLITACSFGSITEAKSTVQKSYANCTELNKDYKGGVAKDANVKNKGGKTRYKPYVSAALYKQNAGKDRDKDGIACER